MIYLDGGYSKNPDNTKASLPGLVTMEICGGEQVTLLTATNLNQLPKLNPKSSTQDFLNSPDMQYMICSIYTGLSQELKPIMDAMGTLGNATALIKIDWFSKEIQILDGFLDFSMRLKNYIKLVNCIVKINGFQYSYMAYFNDKPICYLSTDENHKWERSIFKDDHSQEFIKIIDENLGFVDEFAINPN